jgi:uncharacterized phage-associated protein
MAVSARDVAAALRERIRGLSLAKEHKLLYYCQGHHLATFGEPLFTETVSAWDLGPVIGQHWHAEREGTGSDGSSASLDEAQLNTVGYVVSRYGGMTASDLINSRMRRILGSRPMRPADRARASRSVTSGCGTTSDRTQWTMMTSRWTLMK